MMSLSTWPEISIVAWASCCLVSAAIYTRVVMGYLAAWKQLPDWMPPSGCIPTTFVSVIVPARNEAARLPALLASLSNQSYPATQFEVIVLDDDSEDDSFLLAQNFARNHPNVQAIRLGAQKTGAHKKGAIEAGIVLARGELIACTDADCELPSDWLLLLTAFYEEKKAKFIAAPVIFHREENRFQRFQSLDFVGMMGVTGAGFQSGTGLLCNGANLAYPKAVFQEVGGFEGIEGLASGDDMLLLHKVARRYPEGVFFLKNQGATVLTEAQPDLRSFVSQRLRWASKSRSYEDWRVTARLVVAFLFSWAIVLNLVLAGWLGWTFAVLSGALLLIKSLVDFLFLNETCHYFQRKELMRGYWYSQLMHIAYIVSIGTLANLVRRYDWKGRRVR